MLTYTFPSPITYGTYPNQITVAAMRLSAVSFNFEYALTTEATPICCVRILVEDPATGHKLGSVSVTSAAALAAVQAMLGGTHAATGKTFEAMMLALVLAATDPSSGKLRFPAGGTTT